MYLGVPKAASFFDAVVEVHEREAVSDFLVTYLKDLVATKRPV